MWNKIRPCIIWIVKLGNTRFKIITMATILLLLLGSWVTLQMRQTLETNLGEQLQKQGISVARDVAARSTNYIFTNNLYALHNLVQDTLNNNEDVRYVFILDPEGKPIVHTFDDGTPRGLRDLNQVAGDQYQQIEVINTEEGLIYDVAVPIFEGRAGTARVGISELGMRQVIQETTISLILSTFAVILVGVAMAYLLTTFLTKPIYDLVRVSREVTKGNLKPRISRRFGKDELVYLGEVFNEMLDELEKSQEDMQKYSDELKDKEAKLTELLKKVISAQEEERKRIARELHDQTSQSLASLKVGLQVLQGSLNEEDIAKVKELQKTANQVLDEVHDLALQLRPSVLDDLGLVPAIKRYAREWSAKWGVEVDMHSDTVEQKISSEVEIAIYRVVQEALTNIGKYANAENVSIVIKYSSNELTVIVEDDGVGFNVKEVLKSPLAEKKLGIFGMLERVILINGELTIESDSGEGTTIYVHLPLKEGVEAYEK